MIVFTNIPKRGDIVVGHLASGEVRYIPQKVFVYDEIDQSKYEIIGVVAARRGDRALIVYKTNTSKSWCNTWTVKLTGYTLDGTDRTGTLSLSLTNNSSTRTNVDFPYNATTVEDFVSQLNATFTSLDADKWRHRAYVEDGVVYVAYDYKFWQQSISGSNGFSVSTYTMPDIPHNANIYRANGNNGANGTVSSWDRFVYYYRTKSASLTSDVTTINRSEAVSLQDYLGNSSDGKDHCAFLRQTFGEGEEGWMAQLRSFMPVKPCDYGDMAKGVDFAYKVRDALKDRLNDKGEILCPIFNWVSTVSTQCIPSSEWYIPTVRDLSDILLEVSYGTNPSRTSDVLNAGLSLIKASAISNSSYWWSCCRYGANHAWFSSGSYGFFGGNGLCHGFGALAVSLQRLRM